MTPHNAKACKPREFYDDDADLEYFSRTYKPLSNLPTPPRSSRNSASTSPVLGMDGYEDVDSTLLGPAVHLVNLHPPSASISSPSVSLVQAIIARAALPLETIALAVCILDSLDAKFSLKWRMNLPLATPLLGKRHTVTSVSNFITHIDLVQPEVIILTALIIAFKFTEDCQEPTQYYASEWGKGQWTCDQINATERVIMEHLGYRILPLCDRAIIAYAMDEMRRAGEMVLRDKEILRKTQFGKLEAMHARSASTPVSPGVGESLLGLGLQLTPVNTPTGERDGTFGGGGGESAHQWQLATSGE